MTGSRALVVTVLLVLAAVALVCLAALTKSYVPLFLCWIPQVFIPFVASKESEGRPAN